MLEICPRLDRRALYLGLALAVIALAWSIRRTAATELRNSPVAKAVHDAEPSVVSIHGRKTVRAENASFGTPDAVRQVNGMGTGIVIDPRGYILTNYHVVEGV